MTKDYRNLNKTTVGSKNFVMQYTIDKNKNSNQ